MLAGAEEIEPGRQELQDDERHDDGNCPAEAAEGVDTAEEAGEHGDEQIGLAEAKIIIEAWRRYYNTERPHSSLGYKPPAPEAIIWPAPASGAAPSSAQAIAPRPIMN